MKIVRTILGAIFFALTAMAMVGCATDNPDNISSTPWNQPASWEGALPSNINQGR